MILTELTYLTKFKIHFEEESDITRLELPAILNKTLFDNKYKAPCSIKFPRILAHNEVILHASFINEDLKSAIWIPKFTEI